jgi:putative transposase
MLAPAAFEDWCQQIQLPPPTINLIQHIRASDPSRSVGGGKGNVAGRYPSQKMGVTIQFESHKVELPIIHQFERDPNVLEYYDQPPSIKLEYLSAKGRKLGVLHTPDFFVIRTNSAGWEECKPEQGLLELTQKQPNRYVNNNAQWLCPPGIAFAQQYQLYYHIRSDSEINWIRQRNWSFLDDYLRSKESQKVSSSAIDEINSLLSYQPGIHLLDLLEQLHTATPDDLYSLIATERIHVDLDKHSLAEPNKCPIFADRLTATTLSLNFYTPAIAKAQVSIVDIATSSELLWDGKALTIVHLGNTEAILRISDTQELLQLTRVELENMIGQGKIIQHSNSAASTSQTQADAWQNFRQASPEDQAEALRRYEIIEPYLQGNLPQHESTSLRTIRDWKAKYLAADRASGCGYLGLLSRRSAKGNRTAKLPVVTLNLIQQFITEEYETIKQKNLQSVYGSLLQACERDGVIAPSYRTFTKSVKQKSGYEQTKKRQGKRAAYARSQIYWELSLTTPRHGDRPLEIVHIDHTLLDVETVCSRTNQLLGRPWATFAIDAYTRRLLAVYLTFDPPSYRSCLTILRLCVQKHRRMPQTIVVDNGSEFHSTYFETLLASFECTKKHRPPAQARFGSVCERLFGTSNTQFIHNLAGNTQITRNVRQVTKSVNPKRHALWTLELLSEYLTLWADEVYDTTPHPALGQSPRDSFESGLFVGGNRNHRLIAYDENFKILTLPTTTSGKAKVQPGQGVKINYIYYWSNSFRNPDVEQTLVPVRYDPFDIGTAYAYVKNQWVKCESQYYTTFQNCSEKELKIVTEELRKQRQNHSGQSAISAKKLAAFLADAESQESIQQQRMKDLATHGALKLIDNPDRQSFTVTPSSIEPEITISPIVSEAADAAWTDQLNTPSNPSTVKLEIYDEF